MGSVYLYETFPACSVQELKQKFRNYCDEQREQYGYDTYAGKFNEQRGMRIETRVFATEREAYDWIEPRTDKYGDVIAVKVGQFPELFEESKAYKTLHPAYVEAKAKLEGFDLEVIRRVKTAKSKTKGCSKCGSAIAVAYIGKQLPRTFDLRPAVREAQLVEVHSYSRSSVASPPVYKVHLAEHEGLACPVCEHSFLLTETDLKRKEALMTRFAKVAQRFEEARAAHQASAKNKGYWYVAGWAPY